MRIHKSESQLLNEAFFCASITSTTKIQNGTQKTNTIVQCQRIVRSVQCTQFVNNKNYFLFDRFMLFFSSLLLFDCIEDFFCHFDDGVFVKNISFVRAMIWGTFCTITTAVHRCTACVGSHSLCACACVGSHVGAFVICKWAYTIYFIIYLQKKRNSSGTKFYANSTVSA